MGASPYRGLEPFTESDADAALFFGREPEIEIAIANLLSARLTLLYGPSGVGKTSLLRAGLVHRLRSTGGPARPHGVVIVSDWSDDPPATLVREAQRALRRPGDGAGDDVVAELGRLTASARTELLVVLDQFEEYLARFPGRGPLDEALPALVQRRDLPVRVVLSLREDALAALDRFKGATPGLFGNYLRIEHLDHDAAVAAIERPVEHHNEHAGTPPVELESGLAELVIEELAGARPRNGGGAPTRGAVQPAYLQLVMTRLWEADAAGGAIRCATLAALGGADRIMELHLRGAIGSLSPQDQRLASALLHLLVTPSGVKVRHTARDLAAYVGRPQDDVRRVLEALAGGRARILRAVPAPPGSGERAAYELFHDALAEGVLAWRNDFEAAERRRLETRSTRLLAALIVVSAVALGLAVYLWNPGALRRLDLKTVDARFAVRGDRTPPRDVAIVALDERTLRELDASYPLPRALHARVLRAVENDRPRAIVYDVKFTGRRQPASGDRALLDAIRRSRDHLVLPFFGFRVEPDEETGEPVAEPELMGRPDLAAREGIRMGYSGVPQDDDGVLRRVDYDVPAGEGLRLETLALHGAALAAAEDLRPAELPAARRRAWEEQSRRTTWIDFHGGPGTFPATSFVDVLRDEVPRGTFTGKVVVIGTTARVGGDLHRTAAAGGTTMSGPELQANAVATVRGSAPLRDAPALLDVLATVLLALASVAAFALRPRAAVAVLAVAIGGLLAGSQLAFAAGRVLTVVAPLTALAAGLVTVLLVSLLRRRPGRTRAPYGGAGAGAPGRTAS